MQGKTVPGFDKLVNLTEVIVSTGYDASATTIDLQVGEGTKVPDPAVFGSYYGMYYDATANLLASEDANREWVLFTAKSLDQVTLTRGQQETAASTKNELGHQYRIALVLSAAQMEKYNQLQNSGMSRQAVINSNFNVWSGGTSFVDPVDESTTADKWMAGVGHISGTFPTVTLSRQSLTTGDIPGSFYNYRINTTGAGSGFHTNEYYAIYQDIINGTRFLAGANKQVTISFYAKSSIASKRLGINVQQWYGTGGSPSTTEIITGDNITLTSSWKFYSFTYTLNTLVGKTFGTNNDDFIRVVFWNMWQSASQSQVGAATAESFGGSGNVEFAQVQVCSGDVALEYKQEDGAVEYLRNVGASNILTPTEVTFVRSFDNTYFTKKTFVANKNGNAGDMLEVQSDGKVGNPTTEIVVDYMDAGSIAPTDQSNFNYRFTDEVNGKGHKFFMVNETAGLGVGYNTSNQLVVYSLFYNKVTKAWSKVSTVILTNALTGSLSSAAINNFEIISIDTTKVLIKYACSARLGFMALSVDATTGTITSGAEVQSNANMVPEVSHIAKVDTNKACVFGYVSGVGLVACALSVSTVTITRGADDTVLATPTITVNNGIAQLSAGKMLLTYCNSGGTAIMGEVITISGTTITSTYGSTSLISMATTLTTADTNGITLMYSLFEHQATADQVVVGAWKNNATRVAMQAALVTASGTTLSAAAMSDVPDKSFSSFISKNAVLCVEATTTITGGYVIASTYAGYAIDVTNLLFRKCTSNFATIETNGTDIYCTLGFSYYGNIVVRCVVNNSSTNVIYGFVYPRSEKVLLFTDASYTTNNNVICAFAGVAKTNGISSATGTVLYQNFSGYSELRLRYARAIGTITSSNYILIK